jgi:hypothetical protein
LENNPIISLGFEPATLRIVAASTLLYSSMVVFSEYRDEFFVSETNEARHFFTASNLLMSITFKRYMMVLLL